MTLHKELFLFGFVILASNLHRISSLPYENAVNSQLQNVSKFQFSNGKVFIIGGALADNTASIFNAMKEATGKSSPKVAVAISGSASLADGEISYYEPAGDLKSYEQIFKDYGFEPFLIQLATDNYEVASSSQSVMGARNVEIVQNADLCVKKII